MMFIKLTLIDNDGQHPVFIDTAQIDMEPRGDGNTIIYTNRRPLPYLVTETPEQIIQLIRDQAMVEMAATMAPANVARMNDLYKQGQRAIE